MPCEVIQTPNGKVAATICRGHSKKKPCYVCGKPAPILCDYLVVRDGKPATCDRPCCRDHAVNVAPDRDFCLAHHEQDQKDGGVMAEAFKGWQEKRPQGS